MAPIEKELFGITDSPNSNGTELELQTVHLVVSNKKDPLVR